MNWLEYILIIIIILGCLGIVYAVYFNKLNYYKTRIEKSENIIDDALRKKYDILCEINIQIKKNINLSILKLEKLNMILQKLLMRIIFKQEIIYSLT